MNETIKSIKVLVIEDNDDVRNIICVYLDSKGFTVYEAADGQTGLDMAIRMMPTVILLDVLIPKLDGIETLQALRTSAVTTKIPVILMSAVLQTRDLERETERLRVSSFLHKPFQVRQLIEHIDHALQMPTTSQNGATGAQYVAPTAGARAVTLNAGSPTKPLSPARKMYCKQEKVPSKGTLQSFPLPKLVHSVFAEKKTGRIRILSEGIEKRIYFQNGYPIFAESSLASETLGAYLVRHEKITVEQHHYVQKMIATTSKRYGEILLGEHLIGPHELFLAMESHLAEKIVAIFGWFEGKFVFEDGESWKDEIIVVKMNPGRIILDGIYANWTKDRLNSVRVLNKSNIPFIMNDDLYSSNDLSLTTMEAKVWHLIKQNLRIEEILNQSVDTDLALKMIFFCYLGGIVGFRTEGGLRNASRSNDENKRVRRATPAVVNVGDNAPLNDRSQKLLHDYMIYRDADYFAVLGVTHKSSIDDINKAYLKKRNLYHPDNIGKIKDGTIHEKIEELNLLVHKAYTVLINHKERQKYIESLAATENAVMLSPPGAPSVHPHSIPVTEDSNQNVQKQFDSAFASLREGAFREAEETLSQLVATRPDAKFQAYHLWARYLSNADGYNSVESRLKKLVKKHPENSDVLYILGSLYLKESYKKEAIFCFEKVLKIDSQNIDASRQLRLIRMRANSEVSGLFELLKLKK